MSLERDTKAVQSALLQAEKRYQRTITKAFIDALKEVRAEMSRIYEKYAQNGVLTKAQMSQYGRLASMEEFLASQISTATNKSIAVVNKLKPEQYGEAFARNAWAIDNATGVSIKWGLLNRDTVIANLANPAYDTAIKTLRADAIGKIKIAIEKGLTLGKSYDTMLKDIKKEINIQAYKALRIMRTELHTAQEAGTLATYERAAEQGIEGQVIWTATLDDKTRDTHQDMDGQARAEDGYFDGPGDSRAQYPGDPELPAEERINCIPGDEIPIGIDTEKIYRRWYTGKLVKIKTANGLELRVTPNHPILTDKGWVKADLINEGSNLLSVNLCKEFNMLDMDINYSPPMASKIFNLFRVVSINKRVAGRNHQFHGDGRNSDVDIESINSKLWYSFQSVFYKPLVKLSFSSSNILQGFLSAFSAFNKFCFFALYALNCFMGFGRKLLSLFFSCFGHSFKHSQRPIARNNSIIVENTPDDTSRNIEIMCKFLFGSSFSVELDKVTFVGEDNFSGHVYNLQSKYGMYGVYHKSGRMSMLHNCRCSTRYEIAGLSPALRRSREDGIIPYQTYNEWSENRRIFKE